MAMQTILVTASKTGNSASVPCFLKNLKDFCFGKKKNIKLKLLVWVSYIQV